MNIFEKLKASIVKTLPDTSGPVSVNATDIVKVVRTALLVGGSTTVVEILGNLKPDMFGNHSMLAALVIAVSTDFLMRFIKDNGLSRTK
jgi:hypothetical protein